MTSVPSSVRMPANQATTAWSSASTRIGRAAARRPARAQSSSTPPAAASQSRPLRFRARGSGGASPEGRRRWPPTRGDPLGPAGHRLAGREGWPLGRRFHGQEGNLSQHLATGEQRTAPTQPRGRSPGRSSSLPRARPAGRPAATAARPPPTAEDPRRPTIQLASFDFPESEILGAALRPGPGPARLPGRAGGPAGRPRGGRPRPRAGQGRHGARVPGVGARTSCNDRDRVATADPGPDPRPARAGVRAPGGRACSPTPRPRTATASWSPATWPAAATWSRSATWPRWPRG